MKGKTLILGVLGGLLATVGLIFWIGMSGGSTHVPLSKSGVGFTADKDAAPAAPATGPTARGSDPGAAGDGGRADAAPPVP